ncbi:MULTISPECIES: hypothetical protein [unclassified Streptomyces]|uniref:hypothetical protein n=1 Tax=unclassified Streptomyces TaxID=2593676 RepID=UPI00382C558F
MTLPHWDTQELKIVMQAKRTLTEEEVARRAAEHHAEDLPARERYEALAGR